MRLAELEESSPCRRAIAVARRDPWPGRGTRHSPLGDARRQYCRPYRLPHPDIAGARSVRRGCRWGRGSRRCRCAIGCARRRGTTTSSSPCWCRRSPPLTGQRIARLAFARLSRRASSERRVFSSSTVPAVSRRRVSQSAAASRRRNVLKRRRRVSPARRSMPLTGTRCAICSQPKSRRLRITVRSGQLPQDRRRQRTGRRTWRRTRQSNKSVRRSTAAAAASPARGAPRHRLSKSPARRSAIDGAFVPTSKTR